MTLRKFHIHEEKSYTESIKKYLEWDIAQCSLLFVSVDLLKIHKFQFVHFYLIWIEDPSNLKSSVRQIYNYFYLYDILSI